MSTQLGCHTHPPWPPLSLFLLSSLLLLWITAKDSICLFRLLPLTWREDCAAVTVNDNGQPTTSIVSRQADNGIIMLGESTSRLLAVNATTTSTLVATSILPHVG